MVVKNAAKRKPAKRAPAKRGARKRVGARAGRRTTSPMSIQKLVGVSPALWKNMTATERQGLLAKSKSLTVARLQALRNKHLLLGKDVSKLNLSLHAFTTDDYQKAADQSALTGRF